MRVLVLPDRSFLQRERTLLARLEVGLADEGVRVLHALPRGWSAEGEPVGLYSTVVPYEEQGLPFTTGLRADALVRAVVAAAPPQPDERLCDVVHAFGEEGWPLAAEVASRTGATLVLEVFRPSCISAAGRVIRRLSGAGRVVLSLADPGLRATCNAALPGVTLTEASWGVHLHEPMMRDRATAQAMVAVLVASGNEPQAIKAALDGLALAAAGQAGRGMPLIFVDAQTAERAPVWKMARGLQIESSLSVIADLEVRRDLVLQSDLLILPEVLGEQRTLTLDAMASGMTVVASPDPRVSPLIDGTTCRLVESRTADAWAKAVHAVQQDNEPAKSLRRTAREWVAAHRLASDHVAAVLRTYQTFGRGTPQRTGAAT